MSRRRMCQIRQRWILVVGQAVAMAFQGCGGAVGGSTWGGGMGNQ